MMIMEHNYFDSTTKAGTISGTMLTIFANIYPEDLLKTAMLAAIGATVSFSITIFLKAISKRFGK